MKTFEIKYKKDIVQNHLRINGELVEFKISNGIVQGRNYSSGGGHSAYSNIDVTGSIRGMKKRGFWGKKDEIVRAHGFYFNKSQVLITDAIDAICFLMEKGKISMNYFADANEFEEKTKTITIE